MLDHIHQELIAAPPGQIVDIRKAPKGGNPEEEQAKFRVTRPTTSAQRELSYHPVSTPARMVGDTKLQQVAAIDRARWRAKFDYETGVGL